jgi:nucleoside-diphosphate-sugar epimerase
MRHLITGGSGFLGNLIASRLHAQGESVLTLDVWEDTSRPSGIDFVNTNVCDAAGVARAMQGVDVVHHTAALVPLTKSLGRFWSVNVEGSRIVAEEAVRARVRAFIHMSSSAVYGCPDRCPITDETACHPLEPYGKAKRAGELAVQEICARGQLPLVIVRPRTLLGRGRLGIFQILFSWIQEERDVYVIGSGRQAFQFLHVDDLMDFYMLAVGSGRSGVYNVGTDRFASLRLCLENLIDYAKSTSRVRSLPTGLAINTLKLFDICRLSPLAPWHYLTMHKAFHFDVEPLLRMGWKPRYSNDEMMRESYDWFQANVDDARVMPGSSPHRRGVRERVLSLLKRFS